MPNMKLIWVDEKYAQYALSLKPRISNSYNYYYHLKKWMSGNGKMDMVRTRAWFILKERICTKLAAVVLFCFCCFFFFLLMWKLLFLEFHTDRNVLWSRKEQFMYMLRKLIFRKNCLSRNWLKNWMVIFFSEELGYE